MALNLAARLEVATTTATTSEIPEKFSSLFHGLGNLGELYNIQLKPDARPYALFSPRNIPLPVRPKVWQELKRMEDLGVISKVDVYHSLVCGNGGGSEEEWDRAYLCRPETNVSREVHPLPKVDETLAQLSGQT